MPLNICKQTKNIILPQVYLELIRISMKDLFSENSERLLPVNYSGKKAWLQMFDGVVNEPFSAMFYKKRDII